QFIPCIERDARQPGGLAAFSLNPQKYGNFLVRLFDRWLADFEDDLPTTFIRLFDALFYTYVDMTPPDCHQQETCGNYLVVEHNGDVFPCDFYVEPTRRLGNIRDDTLLNMLRSTQQEAFGNLKKGLPAVCAVCPWFTKCYGGCPRERGFHGDPGNLLCGSLKQFFAHADGFFKEIAKKWKREHGQV
ncbi:MAG: SPASM domain-containing protein, partial [Candidatus Aminicenantes bacterium]|nr:SPASM domain-containing protein [Candidatus Aminicenantes bacterium]